ncbi:hypothetical protein DP44_791 [Burkholderia pseudomallei]|nr:hypothetical protein DP44_791 [Burkholderia pseudomallei]
MSSSLRTGVNLREPDLAVMVCDKLNFFHHLEQCVFHRPCRFGVNHIACLFTDR